jgi:hypothetical protein
MDARKFGRRLALSIALALAVSIVVAPGLALAADEPNGAASCMGLELASISPPGSSDEEPGGARQFVGEVKEFASFLGVKPGALFGFIASLHAGSHADCDEALEG